MRFLYQTSQQRHAFLCVNKSRAKRQLQTFDRLVFVWRSLVLQRVVCGNIQAESEFVANADSSCLVAHVLLHKHLTQLFQHERLSLQQFFDLVNAADREGTERPRNPERGCIGLHLQLHLRELINVQCKLFNDRDC
jgi:hypothetical protein